MREDPLSVSVGPLVGGSVAATRTDQFLYVLGVNDHTRSDRPVPVEHPHLDAEVPSQPLTVQGWTVGVVGA